MDAFETISMIRYALFIFAGACGLGLAAWHGNATYLIGGVIGIGYGAWCIWTQFSYARQDEERARTAPARIEAATAGLEAAEKRKRSDG